MWCSPCDTGTQVAAPAQRLNRLESDKNIHSPGGIAGSTVAKPDVRCDHSTALRHAGHFSLFNVIALSQRGLGRISTAVA